MDDKDILSDTITVDDCYTVDMSTLSWPTANVTISGTSSSAYTIGSGSAGGYLYSTSGMNGTSWATSTAPSKDLTVKGNAEFEGDVTIQGHSILKTLKAIEDRLAILQDPNPAKLEKYAALKKAYDHYKTLERLIGED